MCLKALRHVLFTLYHMDELCVCVCLRAISIQPSCKNSRDGEKKEHKPSNRSLWRWSEIYAQMLSAHTDWKSNESFRNENRINKIFAGGKRANEQHWIVSILKLHGSKKREQFHVAVASFIGASFFKQIVAKIISSSPPATATNLHFLTRRTNS